MIIVYNVHMLPRAVHICHGSNCQPLKFGGILSMETCILHAALSSLYSKTDTSVIHAEWSNRCKECLVCCTIPLHLAHSYGGVTKFTPTKSFQTYARFTRTIGVLIVSPYNDCALAYSFILACMHGISGMILVMIT